RKRREDLSVLLAFAFADRLGRGLSLTVREGGVELPGRQCRLSLRLRQRTGQRIVRAQPARGQRLVGHLLLPRLGAGGPPQRGDLPTALAVVADHAGEERRPAATRIRLTGHALAVLGKGHATAHDGVTHDPALCTEPALGP